MAAPAPGLGSVGAPMVSLPGSYPLPPGWTVITGPDGTKYGVNPADGKTRRIQADGSIAPDVPAANPTDANHPGGGPASALAPYAKDALGFIQPTPIDETGVKKAQNDAFNLSQSLGAERSALPDHSADIYKQQQTNVSGLVNMANGTAPSAAEIQLRAQAARNAAGSYGLAAALQGTNPGAALSAGINGANTANATANEQAAARRADDQSRAQMILAQTLGGMKLQNDDYRKSLLDAQTGATRSEADAAAGAAGVNAKNAASKDMFHRDVLNTLVNL